MLGIYEGQTQPTVTVAGQDDPTGLMRVVIEEGSEPIYLLLAAYEGTIWQIEGATERLSRVVVIPRGARQENGHPWPGAAVLGLDKAVVRFAPPKSCGWYYYKPESVEAIAMRKAVTKTIGRKPDAVLGVYSAMSVSIPSGDVGKPGFFTRTTVLKDGEIVGSDTDWGGMFHGGWELVRQEDWLARAAGIEMIDPDALVAPGRVELYEVLPGQDGLRQLVAEGKLERRYGVYRIVKPIPRFPAGLGGSHSVTFLLTAGIKMPKGDLVHSQVIVEKSGTP